MSVDVKVLFVCVHNAARSRRAGALLRNLGGPRFEGTSAGFGPRRVNSLVVVTVAERGLSLPSTARQPSGFELFKAGRQHRQLYEGYVRNVHALRAELATLRTTVGVARRSTPTDAGGSPSSATAWCSTSSTSRLSARACRVRATTGRAA